MKMGFFNNLKGYYFKKIIINIFLVVVIISIILISGIYISSLNRIKKVTINLNKAILDQISNNVDNQIRFLDKIIIDIGLESNTRTFLSKDTITTSVDNITLIRNIIKTTSRIKGSDLDVHSVYIYSFRNNCIISNGKYTLENFADKEFIKLFGTFDGFHVIPGEIEDEIRNNSFIRIMRMFPLDSNIKNGIVAINMKRDFLSDIAKNLDADNSGELLVLSENGDIILGNDDSDLLSDFFLNEYNSNTVNKNKEYHTLVDENGMKSLVVYQKSKLLNWVYLYITPEKQLTKYYQPFKNVTIILIIISTLISIISIFFISNLIYKPVKKMLDTLIGKIDSQKSYSDEFKFIGDSYNGIIENNLHLESLIEENKHILQERFLYNLLTGETEDENSFIEESNRLNINFDYPYFTVITFEVTNVDIKNQNETDPSIRISDKLQQSFSDIGCVTHFVKLFLKRFSLLINHNNTIDIIKNIEQIMKNSNLIQYDIQISVGQSYEKYSNIMKSFYESTYTPVYKCIYKGSSNVTLVSGNDSNFKMYYFIYKYEKQLVSALKLKSEKDLSVVLSLLVDNLEKHGIDSLVVLKDIILQLIASVLRVVGEQEDDLDSFIHEEELYMKIKNENNQEQLISCLKDISQKAICFLKEKGEGWNLKLIKQVVLLIERNYIEDISISYLADKIFISSSHLSRIFKKITGKTVNDYINYIRIEKAKELLHNPQNSIEKVCKSVGYNSKQIFLRNFKLREGSTPTEFRYKSGISRK